MSPEKPFLESLFAFLNDSEVPYCVLRNHESLPFSLNGSDLDLAVMAQDLDKTCQSVREFIKKQGGSVIMEYRSTGVFIRVLGKSEVGWYGVALDLFPAISYKGFNYVTSEDLIKSSYQYRGIAVADDTAGLVVALVKELLSNGKSRKDYWERVSSLYADHGTAIFDVMGDAFDEEERRHFSKYLSLSEDEADLVALSTRLRGYVCGTNYFKRTVGLVSDFAIRGKRIFKPAGKVVAVVGTDGSGKSTIIDQIKPVLEMVSHCSVHYEHLRPNWLPPLSSFSKNAQVEAKPSVNDDPHGKTSSGFVGSVFRLGYYAVDYVFGYWMKIYPRIVKKTQFCIFDRYFYDFYFDQKRMRLSLPPWVVRLALCLAPQPDIILCLGADPKKIYQRKPETSLTEVTRQVGQLKRFSESHSRAVWIDTGKNVDDSVDRVLCEVQARLSL